VPRHYPTGFRDEIVCRILSDEPVPTVCSDAVDPGKPCIGGNTNSSLMRVSSMGWTRLRARLYALRTQESSFLRKSYSS
jgi:hypothetical protein